jgi:hypothetical protein
MYFELKTVTETVFENHLAGVGVDTNVETEIILSRRKAAAFLGICLTTLDRLNIPKTKIRHRVLYKRDVLIKWVDEHTEKGLRGKK